MSAALKRAGITPDQVDYINAHGTSTMADTIELGAVERLMGAAASKATMSSTKSSIGHLLGAAGAVEAIFCVLAIRDQIAPPTINLDNPAVEPKLDLAPNKAVKRKIDIALSNSFGFGGTNASLVLGKVKG
jgi:3-oxoacyl-[acyl-carrier-protein] synthase II